MKPVDITRKLPKGAALELINFASLTGYSLPGPIEGTLDDETLLVTEWLPTLAARREEAEAAVKEAASTRKVRDAEVVGDLVRKGPDAFAQLVNLIDEADPVADAEADLAKVERTYRAALAARDGLQNYRRSLIGGDLRDEWLALLDRAWVEFVRFPVKSTMTVGELHSLEGMRAELLPMLVGFSFGLEGGLGSVSTENRKRIRAAFDAIDEWDVLPTLDRINERDAERDANSPEAEAKRAAKAAAKAKREADREYARLNAQARRGLHREPENSDEALVGV